MAAFVFPPRFFKVFISHLSSDSMLIPIAYYDELPRHLPKTAILQGPSGGSWNVEMKLKQREVYFEQGWAKFVADNNLQDGEFFTFVYNRDRIFEVSIYCRNGYKEIQAVTEEAKKRSCYSLSSEDRDACSNTEMKNTILESRDKGKSKIDVVEDSDDEEDTVDSLSSEDSETDSDTCPEFKMAKKSQKAGTKIFPGKKNVKALESSDEELESDYSEASDCLDCEETSTSDDSYAPDNEDIITCVKPKMLIPKKKGAAKKKKKVDPLVKNPETYLDNPKNIWFETNVKNRLYELLVHAQLVKDYCLKFGDSIDYIDRFGILPAETAKWKDQRVCIKKWNIICKRNKLKKEDRVLCELLRKKDGVFAIKLHIIRGKNL